MVRNQTKQDTWAAREMAQALQSSKSGSDGYLSLRKDFLKVEPCNIKEVSKTMSLKEAQELAQEKGLAGKASKIQNHAGRNPPGKNASGIKLSEVRGTRGAALTPQQAQALFRAQTGMKDKKPSKDEPMKPKAAKAATNYKDPVKKGVGAPAAEMFRGLEKPQSGLISLSVMA